MKFRNNALGIHGISADELLDKFVAGLKPAVLLKLLKSDPTNLEVAARIAIYVNSALYGAGVFRNRSGPTFGIGNQGSQPMEISTFEIFITVENHVKGRELSRKTRTK